MKLNSQVPLPLLYSQSMRYLNFNKWNRVLPNKASQNKWVRFSSFQQIHVFLTSFTSHVDKFTII